MFTNDELDTILHGLKLRRKTINKQITHAYDDGRIDYAAHLEDKYRLNIKMNIHFRYLRYAAETKDST